MINTSPMTHLKNTNTFSEIIGRFRIDEMDMWDKDYIDLVEEGYIEFDKNGCGEFQFGCVHSGLHSRKNKSEDKNKIDFSFEGSDEGNDVSGRGWVQIINDKQIEGYIAFHDGEASSFKASRKK